jgi:hypothetical protein
VIAAWGVMWSWPFFLLMKKIKRLRYGEIYEIVGLDSLSLPSFEYITDVGLPKETVERIEQK